MGDSERLLVQERRWLMRDSRYGLKIRKAMLQTIGVSLLTAALLVIIMMMTIAGRGIVKHIDRYGLSASINHAFCGKENCR